MEIQAAPKEKRNPDFLNQSMVTLIVCFPNFVGLMD